MAVGDMFINGEHPTKGASVAEMCAAIFTAGLWQSPPEQLMNYALPFIFWLYYRALAGEGGKIEMEVDNGRRIVMWKASSMMREGEQ